VKALFDHPLDELKTETCCALDTVSAVVDEEAMVFSRVQLNADWRGTVLKRVRDQLVGDDPDFLGCGCVEGGGLGLDSNWYRCSVRDAGEQGSCLDGIVGLCEQPVDDGDRLDAGGGVVEGATITVLGAAEQEEVGGGLEVVLDPVICLCRQCAGEFGAGGGALVPDCLAADRLS